MLKMLLSVVYLSLLPERQTLTQARRDGGMRWNLSHWI